MHAMIFHGPGQKSWDEVADPTIECPTDAVVRVDAVTICGTDLHILKGDVPETTPGRVLGHEAVGTVVEVGSGVARVEVGDRVLVSCISSCGSCRFCREQRYGQCTGGGGWILGHTIDGTQAELVRVPFADNSTHPVPSGLSDEQMLMLADIFPTSYEVGVLNGQVKPGDVVVIIGAGPIGLAAVMTSKLFSPSRIVVVDRDSGRLQAALKVGADTVIDNTTEDVVEVVRALTEGLGADVAMEAVGLPATFELAVDVVRPGGHVANIGVHGASAALHLETIWIRDLTITTGLVDTFSTPTLATLAAGGTLDPSGLITHRFRMNEFTEAYDVFSGAADSGSLKVVISR
ncbi:MAG: zinc-dependent alcohol dehydrogenase family protein [Rhodococcus sp. (in: high G+C Gram-positive bacteria)]|uniref:zinc-dependent alcohol dehydrogenase family protein n=1 Tax=Rhodococcus sp. EPR-157 TaxID=1813677 RepID=UPI0007BC2FC1|nr:zinc-dependent alcohol dehydrogenase family protein [Rhodococcus sp. EPR-157]KZF10582.1 alcohol dehydrogenase [Rhodococcus sp. EPR-157]